MKKIILFVLVFGFSVSTHAALISQDDLIFGVGSITSDTDSGLSWLDMNFSTGLSYNELIAATAGGGGFDGFRLAQFAEIQTLFDSAMLPVIGSTTSDFAAVDALIDLIGSTSSQGGFLQSIGITATADSGSSGHLLTGLDFFTENGVPMYLLTDGTTYADNTSFDTVGGWLVRDTAVVPLPPALILFGSALIGLVGFSKRRKKT